ncbi:MAG: hypothetical protein HY547_09595 [Elusimicrobia bacterium]|nr:hypothetical protein [Elusimicrobiota bacterium]
MRHTLPICFIGFGAWGGAVAIHLGRHGIAPIAAWEYLDDLRRIIHETNNHPSLGDSAIIPEGIRLVDNLNDLPITNKSVVVIAVASSHVGRTLRKFPISVKAQSWVILSKGLDPETLTPLTQSAQFVLGARRGTIFALSGPTIAKELIAGASTTAILAGPPGRQRSALLKILNRANFHVSASNDLIGVQIGGAMKNIYALGFGILDGLNAPNNTKAIFLTTALSEMALLAQSMGGTPSSIYGPAGLGDLMTTSLSTNSRNSRLGRLLAYGKSLEESQCEIGMVTEGVEACRIFLELARRKKIKLPLADRIQKSLKTPTNSRELLLN